MNHLRLAFILFVILAGVQASLIAQNPEEKQKPCPEKNLTFVLEASEVSEKIKDLNKQGYCVGIGNLMVVGDKVLLVTGNNDRYVEDEDVEVPEAGHSITYGSSSGSGSGSGKTTPNHK